MGIGSWIEAVDGAAALAFERIRAGIPEQQIVQDLRGLPLGRPGLRLAARNCRNGTDWPVARVRAVLVAAATSRPLIQPTPQEQLDFDDQRRLSELPPDEAFELLAAREPGLRELRKRAQQTMPALRLPRPGDPPESSNDRRFLAFRALHQEASALVGPTSGKLDRLLASHAALRVVSHCAICAGGIEQPDA
jgi:hypothetical protein